MYEIPVYAAVRDDHDFPGLNASERAEIEMSRDVVKQVLCMRPLGVEAGCGWTCTTWTGSTWLSKKPHSNPCSAAPAYGDLLLHGMCNPTILGRRFLVSWQ
jgi:hypothetical protein